MMGGDLTTNVESAQEAKRRNADALLKKVFFNVSTLRQARNRFADQLAPDFRVFDYLRTDEYGLSRCLVELLNPQGKHGQGRVFLDLFLARIEAAAWVGSDRCHSVVAEKVIENSRRIDIYLKFDSGVIGIENKPWAGDQDQQLKAYADWLKKDANDRNWLLIFFSNRDPSEKSILKEERAEHTDNKNLVQINYRELVSWLEECARHSKALVVRVFIEELIKFIRADVNQELDMSEEHEVSKNVLASNETLEAAFLIMQSLGAVKRSLIEKFQIDLKEKIKQKGYFMLWDDNTINGGLYSGFSIYFCEEQNKNLTFEFQNTNLNNLIWGIAAKPPCGVKDEISNIMAKAFGQAKQHKHWPWYDSPNEVEFGHGFKDWSNSPEPWLAIQDGSLADKIVEVAKKVHDAFKNDMALLKS